MAIKRIEAYLGDIGPEKAREFAALLDENRQRKVTPNHREKLADLMLRHDYLTGHLVIAILPDGTKCVANGQHSILAVIDSETTQHFIVEYYRCDNDDDYARLFMAFDTEERRRSWRESSTAFKMARDISVSATTLNYFRSGLEFLFLVNGNPMPDKTRYARFDLVKHHTVALGIFDDMMRIAVDSNIVKRSASIAAMIATVQADADAARKFWTEVFTGIWPTGNISANYPPLRLHNYLREVKVMTGSGSKRTLGVRSGQYGTQFDVYVACIRCWNAWCRQSEIQQIKGAIRGKTPEVHRPIDEEASLIAA